MLRSAVLELATSFRLAVEIVVETGNVPMKIQGQALSFSTKVHRLSLGVEIIQMQV